MGHPRTAACLAIGSELLGPDKVDRNSLEITSLLAQFGVQVREKLVLDDDVGRIAAAVRRCAGEYGVVVLTGGLGPTADDVTRPAVARALGVELVRDDELVKVIRDRYARFGREMPSIATVMADVLPGASVFTNQVGAAPGLAVEAGDALVVLLPGVPAEMRGMLGDELRELLETRFGRKQTTGERTLLVGGVPESDVEERVRPLYDRFGRDTISILASAGVVRLVLRATGRSDEVEQALQEREQAFREVLGEDVAAVDRDSLAEVVVELAGGLGVTVATAESCTGGLIGGALTSVAGSSDVYVGGVVSYSNDVKRDLLGVPLELLEAHGAVSEPVARAMAEGVRRELGTDWGVAVTGIAGPGGGTADKPVGTVHWAVAGPADTGCRQAVFPGDRAAIRRWSVNSALDLLRRLLAAGKAPS